MIATLISLLTLAFALFLKWKFRVQVVRYAIKAYKYIKENHVRSNHRQD